MTCALTMIFRRPGCFAGFEAGIAARDGAGSPAKAKRGAGAASAAALASVIGFARRRLRSAAALAVEIKRQLQRAFATDRLSSTYQN